MGSVISQFPQQQFVADMGSVQADMISELLQDHKVVIFSKTYCPYCTMAKEQFKKLNVPAHVVELDLRNDGDEIQEILGVMTGSRTVPRCFINGIFVGGGTDVKKLYDEGDLQKYFS